MRYWIVTFDEIDYEITRERNFDVLGLPEEKRWANMLNGVSIGDRIIYYASGISRFGAIVECTREYYFESTKIWASFDILWPHRIGTKPIFVLPTDKTTDAKEIVMNLESATEKQKNPKHWALFLRGSMREITERDYNYVTKTLTATVSFETPDLLISDIPSERIEKPVVIELPDDTKRVSSEARPVGDREINQAMIEKLTYEVDNKKREKASRAHQGMVMTIARYLEGLKLKPIENNHVDVAAETRGHILLFEIKSAGTPNKARVQARHAVGQLLEYEHFDIPLLFPNGESKNIIKFLVMNVLPGEPYINYLNGMNISSIQIINEKIVSDAEVKKYL